MRYLKKEGLDEKSRSAIDILAEQVRTITN
jgi:hypothetical protein